MEERPTYVSTDRDLWNSADGSGFFVSKNKAKKLPEETTAIIEDALDQGLLRPATVEEIRQTQFEEQIEDAVRTRKIQAGNTYEETIANYHRYKAQKTAEEKKMTEEKQPEPQSEAPVEESKVEEASVEPETPDEVESEETTEADVEEKAE